MTSSTMRSATLAARLAFESAPGRGMSRVAVGVVIGQSYRGPSLNLTLLTCTFGKRVVPKGRPGQIGAYNENMVCEEGGGS